MSVDFAPELSHLGVADEAFTPRARNGLAREVDSSAASKEVGDCPVDRCDGNSFQEGHILRCQIFAVHYESLALPAAKPGRFRNGEVDRTRVRIGDPVDGERGRTRQGDGLRSAVRLRPENGFPVMRETACRVVGNTVDASGDALDSRALRQSGQDGGGESGAPRLCRRHKAVVVLGERG